MRKRDGERVRCAELSRAGAQAMVPFCGGGRYQDGDGGRRPVRRRDDSTARWSAPLQAVTAEPTIAPMAHTVGGYVVSWGNAVSSAGHDRSVER